jgi:nucleotide-binding universal stress UspA family protein
MNPERLLLPVDIAKCPLEVLELVNGFAKRPEVTVILLHVIEALTASRPRPAHRANHDAEGDALWYLGQLADKHLPPMATALTRVRSGDVAEQILAEAKAENVDLIILPTYRASFFGQLRALWKSGSDSIVSPLAEQVVRAAGCSVFLVQAKTRFNCAQAWGPPVRERLALAC